MSPLAGKCLILGVTGSIAAYKACELASRLVKEGAELHVILTKSAAEFVSPLTFQALSGRPVGVDLFDRHSEEAIQHVALATRAAAALVAPASADHLAKLAAGFADELLTATLLACPAPLVVASAMESHMWMHPATQANIQTLKARGVTIVAPEEGRLASGASGMGRLASPERILSALRRRLALGGDLVGRRIIVTAGGTQEPIDAVRHITNRSSGKMGFAIAEAAYERGADVHLIAGQTNVEPPVGVPVTRVRTAQEMLEAVELAVKHADALIMAAAVADYRPIRASERKLKKSNAPLTIELAPTADILASVQGPSVRVGFAAETDDLLKNAEKKLVEKRLDLIVANDVGRDESTFGSDTNRVVLLHRDGRLDELPVLPKREVGDAVLDRVVELLRRG